MFRNLFVVMLYALSTFTLGACSSSSSGGAAQGFTIKGTWVSACGSAGLHLNEPTTFANSENSYLSFKEDNTFEVRSASFESTDCSGEPSLVYTTEIGTYKFDGEAFSEVPKGYKIDLKGNNGSGPTLYTSLKITDQGVLFPLFSSDASDGSTDEKRIRNFDNAYLLTPTSKFPDETLPQ